MTPPDANEILGVRISLTGWDPGREDDVSKALEVLHPSTPLPKTEELPAVVVETPSKDIAEEAVELLEESGATIEVARVWMSPGAGRTAKPPCPRCGSVRTQPWLHAGPAARVNRSCDDCEHLFRA